MANVYNRPGLIQMGKGKQSAARSWNKAQKAGYYRKQCPFCYKALVKAATKCPHCNTAWH